MNAFLILYAVVVAVCLTTGWALGATWPQLLGFWLGMSALLVVFILLASNKRPPSA